ncbi:DJ-1/PfpI family protein [Dokdonia sp.]|uniref:GlxA family transcriptional regulator n=1 Tax=Dokdonia sp. TaxID=2024995 RepID=UPI003267C613
MRKIIFVIPPKVHLLDINGPAHIFYEAKEYGADVELQFISLNNKTEIESSAGLYFNQLVTFNQIELQENDVLFIPGFEFSLISNKTFLESIQPFLDWVTTQYHKGVHICSVCTGSFILAETGLLNQKIATTHWKYFDQFSKKFPYVVLAKDRLFTSSKNIHSSAGVSSGIDLSLFLIEQFFGTKFALDIAKEAVVYFRRSTSDPQLSIFLQYRNHLDQRIHNAQDYLMHNLSKAPTAEELANQVHMSKRNLTRLFKKTVGITIGKYLEKLRVEKAISLLSEGNKVDFVAKQIGFKSPNQVRFILKKHQDILPTEISSLDK